ncbi:MAG: ATP-binding protein [Eggerthellaceae bacterium]|jgi:signal transduction histidine kinase
MSIRRRMFWANVLMVCVPVVVAVAVGAVLAVGIVGAMQHGTGVGINKSGDFYWAGQTAAEAAEHALDAPEDEATDGWDSLAALLDANRMGMAVTDDAGTVYAHGSAPDGVDALLAAARAVGEDGAVVSAGGTSAFVTHVTYDAGNAYEVVVWGEAGPVSNDALKRMLGTDALIFVAAVVLAAVLTNRFCIRFVYRRIEQSLAELETGVHHVQDGDLSYRIAHETADEFAPICATFNDMAQRLEDSAARAARDEQSRKELIAGISHDLRSPLASIQGYVEGLLDGVAATPERQRRYLQVIERKARDIDGMLAQLLAYSKLDLGESAVALEPVRLDDAVREQVADLDAVLAPEGLDLSCGHLDAAPVLADRTLLARIMRNVADNCMKYGRSADGRPRLRASVTVQGETARLRLADQGPGVASEALGRLFNPLYRADAARTNPAQGSGLGLAVVARAAEAMGGAAHAENAPEGGLVVVVALPCMKGDERDAERPGN